MFYLCSLVVLSTNAFYCLGCLEAIPEHLHSPYLHSAAYG